MTIVVHKPPGLDEHRAMDKRGLETYTRLESQWKGTLKCPDRRWVGSGATHNDLEDFGDSTDLTNKISCSLLFNQEIQYRNMLRNFLI